MIVSRTIDEETRNGVRMKAFILGFPTFLGEGRGLVQIFTGSGLARDVYILTEIKSNPMETGLVTRVPELAAILQEDLALPGPEPLTAGEWYAHYGPFSYHDDIGPAGFTTIPLGWEEGRFTDPISGREVVPDDEAEALRKRLSLPPVEEVLEALGERA
ncbi:hypothetical protein HNR06_002569 [Nocardiopsis arvandica]|uniref:Uncharacterized protein n=1 Tax=Nocardiopsis sinuspersici TaxID=501010 RepID=A0A7Z0BKB1_9ACTN|nr:hypothetical protein [Nocardiopsis sinuspersici]NYH52980.1 hypothetical protein [Nocardiopsis sinuspersici]